MWIRPQSNRQAMRLSIFCAVLFALPATAQRSFDTDILKDTFGFDENTKKSVSLDDLHQGCPAIDCIPSIDNPKYVSADDATHVADDDIVLAISWNGEQRAFPARILDHHEIVNDVIGGTPMAITWCPLCGSAVGVHRKIGGQVTEFSVSGLLYNSDLTFYDRATETIWDQIEAKGIVGPLTGTKLKLIPVTITRWSKWKTVHPDTLILSTDTGFEEDYTQDHYAKYRQSDRIAFPIINSSSALQPKTVVYGFDISGQKIAFTEQLLTKNPTYEFELNDRPVSVSMADDGSVRLTDNESGEAYAPVRLYWFAWYTFHPETELIED